VAHLPAQRAEALVASGASGAGLTAVIRQVSRQLLSGTRLPKPDPDSDHNEGPVRATGPLTGLAELTGQQLAAPPLDGSTEFSATVTKLAGDHLEWLIFPEGPEHDILTFTASNA